MNAQSRLAVAALCRASEASRDPELAALRSEVQELHRTVKKKGVEIQVLRAVLAYFQCSEFRDFDREETVSRILAHWGLEAQLHS